MIAPHATAYFGEDLLDGKFDDVIVSLARKRLFDSDFKYIFGVKGSIGLELKFKSDPSARSRFLMHDAGTLSFFVKTVSYALKGSPLEPYPLQLRTKMSEMYRSPKGTL